MKVFLSYSHHDKEFVTKLAEDLRDRGVVPWLDEWEMSPGDSLSRRIQEGIEESSLFLVILSSTSLSSKWCQKELDAADVLEVEKGRKFVIPILYEKCRLPLFMKAKMYADFSSDYDNGLKKLIKALPITDYREFDVPCPHCGVISKQRIRSATLADMEHKPNDCKNCNTRYFIHVQKGSTGFFTTKTGGNDYGIHPINGLGLIGAAEWILRKKGHGYLLSNSEV
jgi:ssDNA-binding Zn-finger/Zn-ribbon topoisomerase 1